MRPRNKILLASLGLLVGLAFWAARSWPVGIYLWGKFQANFSRGQVAGQVTQRLNVPYHRQEHALSCEAASLKMALDFYGLNISEAELLQKLAFDPTPKSADRWGDPDLGFVGDIDGKMLQTGYGVYAEPIVALARHWKKAAVLPNAGLPDLARELTVAHPVLVWGYSGRGQQASWLTPSGTRVDAANGEHVRVVVGFTGPANNPTGFVLLDPIYGELYWKAPKFEANWAALQHMAVAIYPNEPR